MKWFIYSYSETDTRMNDLDEDHDTRNLRFLDIFRSINLTFVQFYDMIRVLYNNIYITYCKLIKFSESQHF